MADAIVKVVNNRPVVKVAGSELLTPMVAAAQAARDAVRPLFGEGPPDATAGISGSFYRDVSNPYAPLEWFKTDAGWQGPQTLKGDPGGTTDLIGTLQQAQAMTIGHEFAAVRTTGYTAPGDGGGALYKRVVSEPSHAGKFQSVGGQWWELAPQQVVMAEWFGARAWEPGDTHDSNEAFQAASDFAGPGGTWRWRGRHRITYRIHIPRRQTFGSFASATAVNLGDLTNWQGVHSDGAHAIDSAVFFDPPSDDFASAFFCEEGACPQDFTLYGRGFKTLSVNVTKSQPEASYYKTVGIRHNKFIKPRNVTMTLLHTTYVSETWLGEGGNYYSRFDDCEVVRCFQVWDLKSSAVFNMKVYGIRIADVARVMSVTSGLRNCVFYGGSIEGYRLPSPIYGGGDITFNGVYFETFHESLAVQAVFYTSTNNLKFTVRDCRIYLNNCVRFFFAELDLTGIAVNASGNTWVIGASGIVTAHTAFAIASVVQPVAYLFGDTWAQEPGHTGTYVNRSDLDLAYTPRGCSTHTGLMLMRGIDGLAMQALAAAPAAPTSGVIYLANGGSWNPLGRTGGYAYPVVWRGAWQPVAEERQGAAVSNSAAADVAGVNAKLNALLASLRAAKVLAT